LEELIQEFAIVTDRIKKKIDTIIIALSKSLFFLKMKFSYCFFAMFLEIVLSQKPTRLHTPTKRTNLPKNCSFYGGIFTSVMRRIFNPGFHKDLFTEIELMLTTSSLPPQCTLLIEETIPRGMYVDPDQMRDIQAMGGLQAYIPTTVDVEKPEYESESFRVFIFRQLSIQENLRVTSVQLPVHMRYHKPAKVSDSKPTTSAPSAIVKVQNPRLLLTCEGDNIANHCPERAVTSFCDASGMEKCEFLDIPYDVNVNAIEVSVPVGNVEHTTYVVGLTTFLVSGSTIYLLVTLFRSHETSHLHVD